MTALVAELCLGKCRDSQLEDADCLLAVCDSKQGSLGRHIGMIKGLRSPEPSKEPTCITFLGRVVFQLVLPSEHCAAS